MVDQRRHIRRRTLLGGTLSVPRLPLWSLDCAVRNVSEGGARITLDPARLVPETFDLAIGAAPAHHARIVWVRDGYAGLALRPPANWIADEIPSDGPPTERRAAPRGEDPGNGGRLRRRIEAIVGREPGRRETRTRETRSRPTGDFTRP